MPRLIRFQVALWDHIFDDLIRLGKAQHRTYRQQANYYLEEAVKQALRDEDLDLDTCLHDTHLTVPGGAP